MEDISIGVTQASPTGPSVEQRGYEDVSEAEDVDMQSYETSADSSSTGPSAVDQPDTREEFKKEVRQPLKETAPYTPRFWHTRPAPVKASRPKSSVPTARPKPQILSQPNAPKAVAIIIPQPPANAEDSSFVKKLLMAGITVAFFALNGY
ncbi:hypothetical protein C8R44DRAFT_784720 [Mycena epipterygia]|nr:hypothetical protein C8R44DRAFT_784720 [Mycena epipterygia]